MGSIYVGYKKYKKIIEKAIPRVYDEDGEPLSRGDIAERILKAIPDVQKLDLLPFEPFIAPACGSCFYNAGRDKGCWYAMYNEDKHAAEPAPEECPWQYG